MSAHSPPSSASGCTCPRQAPPYLQPPSTCPRSCPSYCGNARPPGASSAPSRVACQSSAPTASVACHSVQNASPYFAVPASPPRSGPGGALPRTSMLLHGHCSVFEFSSSALVHQCIPEVVHSYFSYCYIPTLCRVIHNAKVNWPGSQICLISQSQEYIL